MAKVRLNKVIELLESGQAVLSCGTIANGNYDEIMTLSRSAYDMIILETEHVGFVALRPRQDTVQAGLQGVDVPGRKTHRTRV